MQVDLNMPILVVDGLKTARRMLAGLLIQHGFKNIDEAEDGSSALSKITTIPYKLVISDWNMEPMNGFELLQKIRASENPHIKILPFIMISTESKPENIIKAKQAGVNNYIVKPFNAETLKTKMIAVLGTF